MCREVTSLMGNEMRRHAGKTKEREKWARVRAKVKLSIPRCRAHKISLVKRRSWSCSKKEKKGVSITCACIEG